MFLEEMTQYLGCWNPVDVEEIEPLVVAYQPTYLKQPPQLHRELLRAVPDPEKLFPGASNREAVAYNLRQSLCGFKRAFPSHTKMGSDHGLTGWRDLLRLNLRHATEADRHFTNGQSTATSLVLGDGRLSLALHDDIDAFLTDYAISPSLIAGKVAIVRTELEAEKLACEWLSKFDEYEIAVRVRGKPATMYWRRWGWALGSHGFRRVGLVLTLADRKVWSELNEWMGAYAVLNQLATVLPGVEADTYATCRSFEFSGMSRDMSGRWKGYCMHPERAQISDDSRPVTSVHERCDFHTFVRDADREYPYC